MSCLSKTWLWVEIQENKEKKEECREEIAKGNRKKMLGRKRAGKEQQKETSKKLKVEEEKESEEVEEGDEVELKKLLRRLGSSLEDSEGKRHGRYKAKDEFERVLYEDFRVMFEPDIKSDVWRMLQGIQGRILGKLIDSYYYSYTIPITASTCNSFRFEITSIQSIDLPFSRGYTLGSGEDNMKLIRIDEIFEQTSYKRKEFVWLKLVLPVFVSAVKRMLMLPVQVSAVEVNPVIYTSCIEQFWATAKVQTVNGVRQLQALVDKKRVIVTESSIRRDLYLDDAEGTDCLLTTTIFEELARIGYEKPSQKLTFYKAFFSPQWKYFIHTITQCLSAKSTAWNEFSSSMASLIICLATNQKFNLSKYIFDAIVKHLDGGVKFLLYLLFANMKRAGKDFFRRITPLFDTMMVQPVEEMEIPQDEGQHKESVPTPSNDPQPSGEDGMQLTDLMVLCTKLQTQVLDLQTAKDAQAKDIAALKKRI
ncbi:hypothetical protein Tco_0468647 [Tanacetum coccineum]